MKRSPFTLLSGLLLASFCLLAPPRAEAQGGSDLVLKGGIVSSDFAAIAASGGFGGVAGTAGLETFGQTRFGLGAGVRLAVDGPLALQVEALWLRKAAQLDGVLLVGGNVEFFLPLGVRIDYLELPVSVRYEFRAGDTRPYLFGGAAVAFKMGSDIQSESFDLAVQAGLIERGLEDGIRSTDALLHLGVGLDLSPDGPSGVTVDLRGDWGLLDVFEADASPVFTSDANNRSFVVLVGWRF